MYKRAGIFCIFLMLMATACRQPEKPLPENVVQTASETGIIKSFNQAVIIFIYPDEKKSDSLKKVLGSENFYALSDKKGADFTQLRKIAAANNIPGWSGNEELYRFTTEEGAIIDINVKQVAFPWKVIIFNGKDAPVLAKPEEAARLFQIAMGIRSGDQQRKSSKGKPFSTKTDTSFFKSSEAQEEANKLSELSDLKETTIRLLILPGQTSPPNRDEASGIRVVSSYISPHHRFWLFFDNDMFSNTDRYYTNGVVLGYTAPGLTTWGLNRLMINTNNNSVVHSSLSLHHGMFTPLTTKEPPPLVNDRPYASTLYLRYSQVSENALNGIRITSALDAGVIGDVALGRYFQRSVHSGLPSNDEPVGWETQIQNDLVLNYMVDIQKQLLLSRNIEVYAEGTVNAGTLHTNASMGINAVAGIFSPGLTPIPQQYEQLSAIESPWKYGVNGGLELRMIAYDATLQGGMFNKNNIYALKPDEIERLVAAIHLGLFAKYRKLGINISQYYLSSEFKEGRQHFWGQIGLLYGL